MYESLEDPEAKQERTTLGSKLFSSKGQPKKFSWGDAALTANISEEKVSLTNKKMVSSFYGKFTASYCAKTFLSLHTETEHYIFEQTDFFQVF